MNSVHTSTATYFCHIQKDTVSGEILPKTPVFRTLRELSRHCESLGDGQTAMCHAASAVLDSLYATLPDNMADQFMRYRGAEMEVSRNGLCLLVMQMPQLFTVEDLAYVLAELKED